jgi:hypothetical protein
MEEDGAVLDQTVTRDYYLFATAQISTNGQAQEVIPGNTIRTKCRRQLAR